MKGQKRILATVAADSFVGRDVELETLIAEAHRTDSTSGLHLIAAPGLGLSELLRQTYDRLFRDKNGPIPFYFSFRPDETASAAALRFVQDFILQTVAFRRQNPALLDFGGDICEISQIAVPGDTHWIDRLLETCRLESRLNNERAFIRTALGAPLRAYANGARSFAILDDLDAADPDLLSELNPVFARFEMPFVFASKRRFDIDEIALETTELEPLRFDEAGALAERLAEKLKVAINDQARDLIAVQLGGNPAFITNLIQSASEQDVGLDSFARVQRVYTDEIFGGRTARYLSAILNRNVPDGKLQKQVVGALFDALRPEIGKIHAEDWRRLFNLDADSYYRLLCKLNVQEFISLTSNLIEPMRENLPLCDYLVGRFRLESAKHNRALTIGESLAEFVKRAPVTMAAFYRENSALGLRELLAAFNHQEIPRALLDYGSFRDELKGLPEAEIVKTALGDDDRITLPQIVYAAHTVAVYPSISQVIERSRSAVALGFIESSYRDGDEIVWIAAEIDSKLEASRDLTEFWCDRLEMVAHVCNFQNFKLWLVSPEGFSAEAREVLAERSALGSSRKQIDLLVQFLGAPVTAAERSNEYEMVVPMGEDTEIIAAQTIEEIARRHHFAPKAINQIKTALVEACINASEHSHSPDRKIYQRFFVEEDRITITVSNRGMRLKDKQSREINPTEGRRGWGLKLMRSLMDEVTIEQTDDGTRITMVKMI
ncbi:MAG: ATP-binding protein [Acidobacteria bacterium]|nr:ATP-binding protein [Acidobacteriota bacterium]